MYYLKFMLSVYLHYRIYLYAKNIKFASENN